MKNQVKFQIPSELDDVPLTEVLAGFFADIAPPIIHVKPNEEKTATKSWEWDIIAVALNVTGSWAAKRFVLDPLADKAEEWWRGIARFWEDPRTKSRLHLLVKFEEPGNKVEFELGDTCNKAELKQVWQYIKQASQARALALENGVVFDAVRILPTGTGKMLAIGYTGKRPTYIVDLDTKGIKTIPASDTEEREHAIEALLWKLTVLIEHRDYLLVIAKLGYDVPDERIQNVEREIEAAKHELQC